MARLSQTEQQELQGHLDGVNRASTPGRQSQSAPPLRPGGTPGPSRAGNGGAGATSRVHFGNDIDGPAFVEDREPDLGAANSHAELFPEPLVSAPPSRLQPPALPTWGDLLPPSSSLPPPPAWNGSGWSDHGSPMGSTPHVSLSHDRPLSHTTAAPNSTPFSHHDDVMASPRAARTTSGSKSWMTATGPSQQAAAAASARAAVASSCMNPAQPSSPPFVDWAAAEHEAPFAEDRFRCYNVGASLEDRKLIRFIKRLTQLPRNHGMEGPPRDEVDTQVEALIRQAEYAKGFTTLNLAAEP